MEQSMDQPMEAQEVAMGPVVDDFELGDRVYYLNHKDDTIEYGIITKLYTHHVDITLDGWKIPLIHVDHFKVGGSVGKCFPMEQLEVSSVISLFHSGERIYADILEFVPEKSVRIKYRSDGKEALMTQSTENGPLEFQLACYTLEG